MEILTTKQISDEYGLSYKEALAYLGMKSCPTLPRVKNGSYKILRHKWEEWLERQSK